MICFAIFFLKKIWAVIGKTINIFANVFLVGKKTVKLFQSFTMVIFFSGLPVNFV
jgi:hypothetical protein